jgi:hypothetical protein
MGNNGTSDDGGGGPDEAAIIAVVVVLLLLGAVAVTLLYARWGCTARIALLDLLLGRHGQE